MTSSPVLCAMCGIPCGIVCGIKSLIFKACAVCAVSILTGVRARVCAHTPARTHACRRAHVAHTAHTAHTAHALLINNLRTPPYRTQPRTCRTHTIPTPKNDGVAKLEMIGGEKRRANRIKTAYKEKKTLGNSQVATASKKRP